MLCGGRTEEKDANSEVQNILNGLKHAVKEKLGSDCSELTAIKYSTQVVRGLNYFVKARLSDGKYIHLRIHKDIPSNDSKVTLNAVQIDKSEHEPIEYF